MGKFTKSLTESAITSLGEVTGKRRWKVQIIQAGTGASAVYTTGALETTGALAFPSGTKVNIDHASWRQQDEHPSGSLTTLAGLLVAEPVYNAETKALDSEMELGEEWGPFAEQFHEAIGLSIHADGWGSEYDEAGRPIIEGFIPSPLNTVDLVTVPGANGKLVELMEAYKPDSRDKLSVDESISGKDNGMKPEEFQALLEKFGEALLSKLQPEPVVTATSPVASEISEALIDAKLPKSARERVYKSIENGVTLAEAVTAEQSYIKELTESMKVETGNVVTDTGNDKSFLVGGWK